MTGTLRSSALVDLDAMILPLRKICIECDHFQSGDCKPAACMVGFALRSLQFARQKGILDIPGARKHITQSDMKHYFVENIVPALAQTCLQCRECRDNHSSDCVISLARTCLENTILEKNIEYPGNVFMYLAMVKEQDPEIARMLAKEMQRKKE
ncbi:hypothetical protein [Desulfoscipio gibsoniae]|uniref:Uncharacterized protein n=1 Tax=Desulfoscipio gibsoniae DSM 7213 TaxID=767817 RepID=R4KDN3_9FIRM|nr:hypothetical protein [Desulfoscipio gibsoniae]AGK99796.1 hypothetical protein Desgi_0185 [Desulfoscipio gibsoniae DSM 7213]